MRRITALVVDDSPFMRQAIAGLLRTLPGCTVLGEGANGVEALELTRTLHPTLVVMDIHMPLMTGLEALRHLQSELPHAGVVLVTAMMDADLRDAARRGGALACVEKGAELWEALPALVQRLASEPHGSA